MNTLTQTQTQLLIERLSAWDDIDKAIEDGRLATAADLTHTINTQLTPNIRRGYGL